MGRRRKRVSGQAQPAKAAYRYAGRDVRDDEFVQRVRRYTPSSLVANVAIAGARYWDRDEWFKRKSRGSKDPWIPPWALAEIARTSIIHGTEFQRQTATYDNLVSCYAAYMSYMDPDLKKQTREGLARFFLRFSNEQLPMQQSGFGDYGRTPAMFLHTPVPGHHEPKVLKTGWEQELLGCTLIEYVAAAQLIDTSTSVPGNLGRFDLDWLSQPNFKPITDEVPAETLHGIIERQYIASSQELKELQTAVQAALRERQGPLRAAHRRFGFNPLTSRPVVAGLHDDLLIPVPALIPKKASPTGIYYEGLKKWGTAFTTDLGHLFEAYVGRQLGLLEDGMVHPEIRYGPKKSDLSVDWLVVFSDCVVLVEAKSCGPTEAVRTGGSDAGEAIAGKLGHAVEQLNNTARLIRDRAPGFEAIPADRPILGLVATLDPFHSVNSSLLDVLPDSAIPFAVCSASEIEQWVVVDDASPGTVLLEHATESTLFGWSVNTALTGHEPRRNAVLDEGWASLPWKSKDEKQDPSDASV